MTIGERIKQRRLELGWSQQKLADMMGYTSKSTITKIEKGNNDVAQRNIAKFADVLGVSIAYLMDWDEESQDFAVITNDPVLGELTRLIEKATPEQKENLLAIAKALLHKQ